MASKTWKIGEYCRGGIITAVATANSAIVIGRDWDLSKGTQRGSNQSNAKEFCRIKVKADNSNALNQLEEFLNDLTTAYYTDIVLDWIQSKVELKRSWGW